MFWKPSIKSRVWAVIAARIQVAQEKYEAELSEYEAKVEVEKEAIAQKHAESVL